jgi:hypothetical protein
LIIISHKSNLPFARLGYTKKGWIDGEISVEWIKLFDKHTATKAAGGKYQLLLIDGHNSHYTHAWVP